uniref:Mycobacterium numidiamassiliense ORFan n=1 Tax=Steinernema glaseri TaxID=37863 RepID=A0A1I8AB92_9BILA
MATTPYQPGRIIGIEGVAAAIGSATKECCHLRGGKSRVRKRSTAQGNLITIAVLFALGPAGRTGKNNKGQRLSANCVE